MTPQKFWMAWIHDTPPPVHRHPSLGLATAEADRLARQLVGKKVYILEAVDYRFIEQLPLTTIRL